MGPDHAFARLQWVLTRVYADTNLVGRDSSAVTTALLVLLRLLERTFAPRAVASDISGLPNYSALVRCSSS